MPESVDGCDQSRWNCGTNAFLKCCWISSTCCSSVLGAGWTSLSVGISTGTEDVEGEPVDSIGGELGSTVDTLFVESGMLATEGAWLDAWEA